MPGSSPEHRDWGLWLVLSCPEGTLDKFHIFRNYGSWDREALPLSWCSQEFWGMNHINHCLDKLQLRNFCVPYQNLFKLIRIICLNFSLQRCLSICMHTHIQEYLFMNDIYLLSFIGLFSSIEISYSLVCPMSIL